MAELWEGARRLPYFFSYGHPDGAGSRDILCPQCALEHADVKVEKLRAHYHADRTLMCARCGILIGPISNEEMI